MSCSAQNSSPVDIYASLLTLEKKYASDKSCENYAKVVHQMHPEVMKADEKSNISKGEVSMSMYHQLQLMGPEN